MIALSRDAIDREDWSRIGDLNMGDSPVNSIVWSNESQSKVELLNFYNPPRPLVLNFGSYT